MKTKNTIVNDKDRKVNKIRNQKQVYRSPLLKCHGKVTDITLGGSPSVIVLESDGCTGQFGTPKNGPPTCP